MCWPAVNPEGPEVPQLGQSLSPQQDPGPSSPPCREPALQTHLAQQCCLMIKLLWPAQEGRLMCYHSVRDHRRVEVGRSLWRLAGPTPCLSRVPQSNLPRTRSRWLLHIFSCKHQTRQMPFCLASFPESCVCAWDQKCLTATALDMELVEPVPEGTPQLPTLASPTREAPSEGLPRAVLTTQGNYFALQKCDVCEAEAALETSEGKAALGYEGGILEGAVASLTAFKWAVIKGNGKTFPCCKHVSVYLPFKELNKVAGFNKLEFESNEKAWGQILLESSPSNLWLRGGQIKFDKSKSDPDFLNAGRFQRLGHYRTWDFCESACYMVWCIETQTNVRHMERPLYIMRDVKNRMTV